MEQYKWLVTKADKELRLILLMSGIFVSSSLLFFLSFFFREYNLELRHASLCLVFLSTFVLSRTPARWERYQKKYQKLDNQLKPKESRHRTVDPE